MEPPTLHNFWAQNANLCSCNTYGMLQRQASCKQNFIKPKDTVDKQKSNVTFSAKMRRTLTESVVENVHSGCLSAVSALTVD